MSQRLDPDRTFGAYNVAPGTRMAVSAARRMAETPGTYNPLVLHGPAGVGKTHLLHAIGNRTLELRPRARIVLEPMESFVARLNEAVSRDRLDDFQKECQRIDLLLLDDAQLLCGRGRTQEQILPIWDLMGRQGGQVVLACDRPPSEIERLDSRIAARFARAFTVDLRPAGGDAAGGPTMRAVSAARREEWPAEFELGTPAAPAEGRAGAATPDPEDPFASFLSDITETLEEVVDATPWRAVLAETILRWGGEGMRTWRLENALELDEVADAEALLTAYEADATRLQRIADEIATLDPRAAASPVLRDPDRVAEAEALLLEARMEHRALPPVPPGLTLSGFVGRDGLESPAVSTARRVVAELGRSHNPLVVHGPADRCTHYLAAIGHAAAASHDRVRSSLIRGRDLADEARIALEVGYGDSWRRRYEALDLALIEGVEPLVGDPRTQELLLTLLDTLLRNGTQVVLSTEVPLRRLHGLDPRLLSRIEGGVTVDLAASAPRRLINGAPPAGTEVTAATAAGAPDLWFFNREKLAWDWVALDERLIEELT